MNIQCPTLYLSVYLNIYYRAFNNNNSKFLPVIYKNNCRLLNLKHIYCNYLRLMFRKKGAYFDNLGDYLSIKREDKKSHIRLLAASSNSA